MKCYIKKTTGQVYGFDLDGSQDFLITDEFEQMTDYELNVHIGGHANAIATASVGFLDKVKGFFSAK